MPTDLITGDNRGTAEAIEGHPPSGFLHEVVGGHRERQGDGDDHESALETR